MVNNELSERGEALICSVCRLIFMAQILLPQPVASYQHDVTGHEIGKKEQLALGAGIVAPAHSVNDLLTSLTGVHSRC